MKTIITLFFALILSIVFCEAQVAAQTQMPTQQAVITALHAQHTLPAVQGSTLPNTNPAAQYKILYAEYVYLCGGERTTSYQCPEPSLQTNQTIQYTQGGGYWLFTILYANAQWQVIL